MRLFDSARPTSDGIPLYAPGGNVAGKSVGLPLLYVQSGSTEGEWILTIHMPNSHNAFGGYDAKVSSTAELTSIFERWLVDPEGVISEVFRYDPSVRTTLRRAKSAQSERSVAAGLAELGLD